MRTTARTLFFAAGLFLGGARLMAGCTPKEKLSVENAAAVAQFDRALVDCKKLAKDAGGDFAIYDDCERSLAKHYCSESAALREHWPICKEVLP